LSGPEQRDDRQATASDYTWFSEHCPDLADAFCLTLVRGLTPAEVLRRIDVRQTTNLTGFGEMLRAYNAWATTIGNDLGRLTELFVAGTSVDGWTLAVEPNGFLGVTDEIAVALSHGTSAVSVFRNVNVLNCFRWTEDGKVRLKFEPLFPTRREGSDADSLVEVMRQVGFDFREGDDRDIENFIEAALALMEHVTGVRLTFAHLQSAQYLCGTAPLPRS
jgi:uncharacterized protein DUF6461